MIFLYSLASITLIISPLIILLLILAPLMDKKFLAGGRHLLWIVIMAGLCLPFISFIHRPAIQIDVNVPQAIDYQQPYADINNDNKTIEPLDNTQSKDIYNNIKSFAHDVQGSIDIYELILFIWLLGVFLTLAYQIAVYLSFKRFVRRWSSTEIDPSVILAFHDEALNMGIVEPIKLASCNGISTPILIGLFKPSLLLPSSLPELEDLKFIFRHELIHYRRHDLWYKLSLLIIKSIYWFNPAVYLMATQANKDIEIICDSLTVSGMDLSLRKQYSEIILSVALDPHIRQSQLTTSFTGGRKMLRQRISNILGSAKKSGTAIFIAIGIIIITIGLLVSFNFVSKPQETSDIVNANTPIKTDPAIDDNSTDDNSSKDFWGNIKDFLENMNDLSESMVTLSEHITDGVNMINDGFEDFDSYKKDIIYYDNVDELKKLVYDDAKVIERKYDNVSALKISTAADNVKITSGGNKLIVRYYEWLNDEYSLDIKNGELSLMLGKLPYLRTGNVYTDGWFISYLRSQGKKLDNTIDIIIPNSMTLDSIEIDTASGYVNIQNQKLIKNMTICTASGQVNIEDCVASDITISTASSNGYVKLAESAKNYDISCDVVTGKLIYNGENINKNQLKNKNAASHVNFNSATGSLNINDIEN